MTPPLLRDHKDISKLLDVAATLALTCQHEQPPHTHTTARRGSRDLVLEYSAGHSNTTNFLNFFVSVIKCLK
jgi:hypothetical protein